MAKEKVDDTLLPYKRVAGFHLKRLLGEGGMGAVYEAVEPRRHGHVALKIMREELADVPVHLERFEAEARNLATLTHTNIATYVAHGVHRRGRKKPLYYLAMRFLQGCTLEQYVDTYGPRPVEEAIWIIAQACRGIHAAHHIKMIHRDVKPSNIFLVHAGDGVITCVKVIDFGIAKVRDEDENMEHLTRTGTWLGTLAYMSPEQLAAQKDLDDRSDIYSLGLVLYYLLTGKHAFENKSPALVYEAQMKGFSAIPGLDPKLMDIIRQATAFKREERYEFVGELTAALELCRPDLFMAPPVSEGAIPAEGVAPTVVMPLMPPAPAAVPYGMPPAHKASDDPDATDEQHDGIPRAVKWFAKALFILALLAALVVMSIWWENIHMSTSTPTSPSVIPTTVTDAAAPRPGDAAVTTDSSAPHPRHRSTPRVRIRLPNGGGAYTLPTLREWGRLAPRQQDHICRLLRENRYQIPPGYCPTIPQAPPPGDFGRFGGVGQTGRPNWVDN